jgi:hypothetical protein
VRKNGARMSHQAPLLVIDSIGALRAWRDVVVDVARWQNGFSEPKPLLIRNIYYCSRRWRRRQQQRVRSRGRADGAYGTWRAQRVRPRSGRHRPGSTALT